jgi:Domain of unknown function (DUF6134)
MRPLLTRVDLATAACVAAGILAILSAPVRGAETEEREFAVTVDSKGAGTFHLTARADDDGTETITATANVKISYLLGSYKYTLRSAEVWKRERLISLESSSNDDGKKHTVKASAANDLLTVMVDGQSRKIRGDAFTTTGWRLPTIDKSRASLLLDTEDGTDTPVRLEWVGQCDVEAAGTSVRAQHFRLTGKDVDVDWWFDGSGRPVRQEMKWDGHKVALQLTGVKR